MYEEEWVEELIFENRELRRENRKLKIELQESGRRYYDFIDELFKDTKKATASMLKSLLPDD